MIATSPKKNPCFYGTPLPPSPFMSSSCARAFLPPCPCLRFAQVPPWGIDPWVLRGQKIYPVCTHDWSNTPTYSATSPPPSQNPNLSHFPGLCSFPISNLVFFPLFVACVFVCFLSSVLFFQFLFCFILPLTFFPDPSFYRLL